MQTLHDVKMSEFLGFSLLQIPKIRIGCSRLGTKNENMAR